MAKSEPVPVAEVVADDGAIPISAHAIEQSIDAAHVAFLCAVHKCKASDRVTAARFAELHTATTKARI